jgi:hypothetical protein
VEVAAAVALSKVLMVQVQVRQVGMDLLQSYIFTQDKERG